MRSIHVLAILIGLAGWPLPAAAVTEIPEPSSLAMLGGTLLAGGALISILTVLRKRRSRRKDRAVENH